VAAAVRLGRRCLPLLISAGLLGWLSWRVPPLKLVQAAAVLDWPLLGLLTAALLVALFAWDAVCLTWLFSQPDHPLRYRTVLHARAASYLWAVLNYEIGQGVLAWRLGRLCGMTLGASLGRVVLLALHDVAVLLGFALVGALVLARPRSPAIAAACAGSLLGLAMIALLLKRLPPRWRGWLPQRGSFLDWWGRRHSLTLLGLRLGFFLILWLYVALALRVCGIGEDGRVLGGAVPMALLFELVPSISGLGTRDTALLTVLQPSEGQEALVMSFTLFWSTGLLIGRLLIGLVSWWLPWRDQASSPAPDAR
jgi:hypothetical protein